MTSPAPSPSAPLAGAQAAPPAATPAQAPRTAPAGLSAAEAATRLAADGPNALPGSAPKRTAAIVREVLTEPMFLMLLAAGGIYLALGSLGEALFLLGFVGVVIGITLVQERRTQRALESLRDLSAPRALVRRDGVEQRIASREVVRGDCLVLREGDRVAADAQLISGQVSVNESLLTGEAVPVRKRPASASSSNAESAAEPGGEDTPWLFASTVVTQGMGLAEVRDTGGRTAVGRIGAALSATTEPPSALQLGSRRLVRWLGAGALLTAVALVLLGWLWDGRPLLDALLSGIALAMAILPEEIPVILTVFLALGAWRIAQQQVLTRRVSAVESLGAITVLAVDKTGTLTQNRMALAALVCDGQTYTLPRTPAAAAPGPKPATAAGSAVPQTLAADAPWPARVQRLIDLARLATPPQAFDPMEKAILAAAQAHPGEGDAAQFQAPALHEYPLSSDLLAMTRVHAAPAGSGLLLACKGAPEAVADLCRFNDEQRRQLREQVEACADQGLRLLGVAEGHWPANVSPAEPAASAAASPTSAHAAQAGAAPPRWPASQRELPFQLLGLLALEDPPRGDVPAALAECRQAGIRVIMMTGDHPATARAIARQVGLSERPEVLTGAEIESLDDARLSERLRHTDLCARLQPSHKLRLVQQLRQAGEVVAMTGDGVNDAPALKAADVGIAMGERGTDVAREAASIVLLDDRFTRIVAAVRQGRRIYDNIVKATRFTVAVHIPIIGLALVPALLHWPLLLLPVHIVLLELLIDPACSVVFEAEPERPGTMQRPPRSGSDSPFAAGNLLRGLAQGLGVAAILLTGQALLLAQAAADAAPGRSAVFIALLSSVLLLTLANRDRLLGGLRDPGAANPWLPRMAAAIGAMLLLVMAVPALRRVMGLAWPDARSLWAALLMVLACTAWLMLTRWATARLDFRRQRAGSRLAARAAARAQAQTPDQALASASSAAQASAAAPVSPPP